MIDLGTYIFKDLNTKKIALEEYFTDANFKEVYESEHAHNAKKILCVILNAKYEKAN